MADPIVLVPGLACSARLYGEQIPDLWRHGPVTLADHTRNDTVEAIAARILAQAPPRFALAGLSMGGYIALAMLRQAPERIIRLALLDTSARPDTTEQSALRRQRMARAEAGQLMALTDELFPALVHASRHADAGLMACNRAMAEEVGADAYIRQQRAIMARPDARPLLACIACPTLVLVGEGDALTPPALAQEMAGAIAGARLVSVPQCGHLSTLEQPQAVTEALVAWLAA